MPISDPLDTLELPAGWNSAAIDSVRRVLALLESADAETPHRSSATAEIERILSPSWRSVSSLVLSLFLWRNRIGRFRPAGACVTEDDRIELELRDARDRPWLLRIRLDRDARLAAVSLRRPSPDGVVIRRADEEDWEALAQLERACPTEVAPGISASTDRGAALRDHFELQGEYAIWVAEHAREIVGARAFSVREAVIDGTPRRLCYSQFVRILPAWQSRGIFQPLDALAGEELLNTSDGMFAYMDPRNEAMRKAIGGTVGISEDDWRVLARRLSIPTSIYTGPSFGRAAKPSDAARIAALVNAAHGREGFFAPYSEQVVGERLSRAPHAYGWESVRISSHAVVGAWLSREQRRIEREGVVRETVRGLVLDFGFEGEEGRVELAELLRHWCGVARGAGISHLELFCSEPSAAWPIVAPFAEDFESYEFPCVIPAPKDLERKGLYVDAVYF